jgi:hypothetical protein
MVEGLVREFIPNALAADLDFSSLQRVNAKFHIARRSAARREGDVIWRVPNRKGSGSSLYLLIEFQSESDWWMAVRTQVYQGLLWQQLIREKKLKRGARLPPLLLLVLYNGTPRWSAPTKLSDQIALAPDSRLWSWQPQVRYHLLDIGAIARSKLHRHDSLMALLFRLEQPYSLLQLERLIGEVAAWFRRRKGFGELKRLFRELICKAIRSAGIRVPIPNDLMGMKNMLAMQGRIWKEQWRAEGEAKGLAKGLAKGEAKGEARGWTKSLEYLLVRRFGALPPSVRKRIRGAKLANIERWFKRALDSRDLSSVFDPPR